MTYVAVVVNRYGFVVSSILAGIAARRGRIPRGRQHVLQRLDVFDSVAQNLHFRQPLARIVASPTLQRFKGFIDLPRQVIHPISSNPICCFFAKNGTVSFGRLSLVKTPFVLFSHSE